MSTLTMPTTFSDSAVLTAAQLNGNFGAVTTWAAGGIGTDNLATPRGLFAHTVRLAGPISASDSFRFKAPSGITLVPVEFQVAYEDEAAGTAAGTFQATANGVSMLNAALVLNTPDTVVTSTSFAVSSVTSGQVIIGTVTVSSSNISNVLVTMFFKALLQG